MLQHFVFEDSGKSLWLWDCGLKDTATLFMRQEKAEIQDINKSGGVVCLERWATTVCVCQKIFTTLDKLPFLNDLASF